MNRASLSFALVGLVVVSTAAISGPLVPGVDLSPEPGTAGVEPNPGSGNVTVESVSLDGEFVVKKGAFGSGQYVLLAPDAIVTVGQVEGQPIVTYKIQVHGVGISRSSVAFLSPENSQRQVLSMGEKTVSPDRVDQDQFEIGVVVTARDEGGADEVFNETVFAEVRGNRE
jgi:hypothetical protein